MECAERLARLDRSEPTSGARDALCSPTLVERIVEASRLPYYLGSLLLGMVVGPVGFVLVYALETGSLARAFDLFFQGLKPEYAWQQAVEVAAWTAHAVYTFWMVRLVRVRLLEAENKIAPLLPGGETTYRRAFRGIDRTLPPLLLAFLVIGTFSFSLIPGVTASGPIGRVYTFVRWLLMSLAHGSAVWVYVSGVWGLVRLGREPLRLDFFHEDKIMGTKPLGALSLSLTFAYSGFVMLLAVIVVVSPVLVQLTVTVAALLLLGVALFLLPLFGFHAQMTRKKDAQQSALRQRLMELALAPGPQGPESGDASGLRVDLRGVRTALADLRTLMAIEAAEPRVKEVKTWPVDLAILGRLAATIVPPLVAIVLDIMRDTLLSV